MRVLSDLSVSDADFMIGQNNETKLEERANTADEKTSLDNANN